MVASFLFFPFTIKNRNVSQNRILSPQSGCWTSETMPLLPRKVHCSEARGGEHSVEWSVLFEFCFLQGTWGYSVCKERWFRQGDLHGTAVGCDCRLGRNLVAEASGERCVLDPALCPGTEGMRGDPLWWPVMHHWVADDILICPAGTVLPRQCMKVRTAVHSLTGNL